MAFRLQSFTLALVIVKAWHCRALILLLTVHVSSEFFLGCSTCSDYYVCKPSTAFIWNASSSVILCEVISYFYFQLYSPVVMGSLRCLGFALVSNLHSGLCSNVLHLVCTLARGRVTFRQTERALLERGVCPERVSSAHVGSAGSPFYTTSCIKTSLPTFKLWRGESTWKETLALKDKTDWMVLNVVKQLQSFTTFCILRSCKFNSEPNRKTHFQWNN